MGINLSFVLNGLTTNQVGPTNQFEPLCQINVLVTKSEAKSRNDLETDARAVEYQTKLESGIDSVPRHTN